jgi:hypothetical protein
MMQMYDVGMSSLVCQEAYSLAELAKLVGKESSIRERLLKRADNLRDSIQLYLWDATRQIYSNRYRLHNNESFVLHITPTSFYPFLLHGLSNKQHEGIIKSWLMNATRFCISPHGNFHGNDPNQCYWGLPSVSADDPTFMKGNFIYWRGLTWGPMALLTFWSLQKERSETTSYDTAVQARKALSWQMEALMMSQWNTNRHICENYR